MGRGEQHPRHDLVWPKLAGAARAPHSRDTRLELTPAPVLGSISYPTPQEGPTTAVEEARSGLEQLATAAYRAANSLRTIESPPTHTASELRECATSLAMAHVVAADLLARLSPYLPTHPGPNLSGGADQLRAAGAAWIALRRPWRQIASVPDSGPRSPLTIQANSIVVRFGRLLYTDPTWNPQGGPGQLRSVADLLEPQILDALCTAISALPRCATIIGTNHARLIASATVDLYSADRTHRPEGHGRPFYPLQPVQRTELTIGLQKAARASQAAATGLAALSRGYEALKAYSLVRTPRPTAGSTRIEPRPTQPSSALQPSIRGVTPNK